MEITHRTQARARAPPPHGASHSQILYLIYSEKKKSLTIDY